MDVAHLYGTGLTQDMTDGEHVEAGAHMFGG